MQELSSDPFWNVRDREAHEESFLRREIAQTQAQIEVRKRALALTHATGFQDFIKSLQVLHAANRERLVGDESLTDAGLREMRGRVRGIESVLSILTASDTDKVLAERLAERKNQLDEALKRRPRQRNEVST